MKVKEWAKSLRHVIPIGFIFMAAGILSPVVFGSELSPVESDGGRNMRAAAFEETKADESSSLVPFQGQSLFPLPVLTPATQDNPLANMREKLDRWQSEIEMELPRVQDEVDAFYASLDAYVERVRNAEDGWQQRNGASDVVRGVRESLESYRNWIRIVLYHDEVVKTVPPDSSGSRSRAGELIGGVFRDIDAGRESLVASRVDLINDYLRAIPANDDQADGLIRELSRKRLSGERIALRIHAFRNELEMMGSAVPQKHRGEMAVTA